ncbi:DUF1330 domain-containing protein [Neokomagataea anthophila]|uniref:DUF1330 domain-containing protein n=1 Tax=Neokomagataea anthophila TaxID=2826925 RepID=A0ABS5E872_9PROT|nr:DUF1330 domain-containing protein [Neokomagataea anthophila]MBR0560109.1 DUF1330 domain-containing protein [Neokomagataea anthophila]
MEIYSALAAKPLRGTHYEVLVAYGEQTCFEGQGPEGGAVVKFPDRDAALSWYNGEAYRELREHRFLGAKYQVTFLVRV